MTWKTYLSAIMDTGLTQTQVADAIGRRQSTISDIYSGKTTDPRSSIGLALISLGKRLRVSGAPEYPVKLRSRKK